MRVLVHLGDSFAEQIAAACPGRRDDRRPDRRSDRPGAPRRRVADAPVGHAEPRRRPRDARASRGCTRSAPASTASRSTSSAIACSPARAARARSRSRNGCSRRCSRSRRSCPAVWLRAFPTLVELPPDDGRPPREDARARRHRRHRPRRRRARPPLRHACARAPPPRGGEPAVRRRDRDVARGSRGDGRPSRAGRAGHRRHPRPHR